MFEIEAVSMKHPKEYKSVSYLSERPKTFVFGKMNSLLVLHGGFITNVFYLIRQNANILKSDGTQPVGHR